MSPILSGGLLELNVNQKRHHNSLDRSGGTSQRMKDEGRGMKREKILSSFRLHPSSFEFAIGGQK
jgi:hypothetical protein